MEIIGQADEKEFFERGLREKLFQTLAESVAAGRWLEWFNGPVQEVFQAYGFFDPEGVFIGDGSYLFVPDNPAYEGSVVMWFDEHNHPVDYEKLSAAERRKAQAPPPNPASVLSARELCPIKGFQWAEARLPLHVLLLRETYADGHQDGWALLTTEDFPDPQQPPQDYHRRVAIEERHRQIKCFYDLTDFHSRTLNAVTAQVVFVLLSYTLRQCLNWSEL